MKLNLYSNKIIPIILAAGRGSRMGSLTKKNPKSFVKIYKNKRLIDNIIENFEKLGFNNKIIITGYKSKQFNQFRKIKKIKNDK